jgi:heme-degrading monooxygenase HmoA
MIAVIFEAEPHTDQQQAYLNAAAALRPQLEQMSGFISIERFESLTTPGKLLSLSFWQDEESVRAWRNVEAHRAIQAAGRDAIFADYRLRVAAVLRDYGMTQREQAPDDSQRAHPSRYSPPKKIL